MLGARAGEAVDRLVVVADGAQLVRGTEPALEQRLLEKVDVLVLVDCERAVAVAETSSAPSRPRRRAGSQARADPRSRPRPRPPSAARTRRRRSRRGRPGSAAGGRRARAGTSQASAAGSSPTRSRWRGRPPAGTCTGPAACCRSGGGGAPSTRGSGRRDRVRSGGAGRGPPNGRCVPQHPRRRAARAVRASLPPPCP